MKKQKFNNFKSNVSNNKKAVFFCLLGAVLVIVITVVLIIFFTQDETNRPASANNNNSYMEEQVLRSDIVVGVTEMGSATLEATAVSFSFQTEIIEIDVKPGHFVNEGDPIATIDPSTYDQLYTDTKLAYDQAWLKLEQQRLNSTTEKLAAEQQYNSDISNGNNAGTLYNISVSELQTGYDKIVSEITALETSLPVLFAQADSEAQIRNTFQAEYDAIALAKTEVEELLADYATTGVITPYTYNGTVYATEIDLNDLITTVLDPNLATKKNELDTASAQYDKTIAEYIQDQTELSNQYIERDNYSATMELKTIEIQSDYNGNLNDYNQALATYENTVALINNELSQSEQAFEELKQELELLNEMTVDGTIVSPVSGYVMTVADTGTNLNANSSIVTIADSKVVNVYVSIPQEDIADISIDMPVNIVFDAYDDVVIKSMVDSISITPASGMQSSVNYTVGIVCDMSAYQDIVIYQGMTADITFVEKQVENVLVVSNKCIILQDGKQYVNVYDDTGNVTLVEVQTGFSDGFDVEITYGLSDGDIVLIESAVTANAV